MQLFLHKKCANKIYTKYTINVTIFTQENVVIKYTRNTRINECILCIFFYEKYTRNTHDYAVM